MGKASASVIKKKSVLIAVLKKILQSVLYPFGGSGTLIPLVFAKRRDMKGFPGPGKPFMSLRFAKTRETGLAD
jgi:hypothetical protein